MKTISKIFAIVLVIGLVFGFATSWDVNAATLDVCPTCTYTTIQAAVDAAGPGDTVNVAAGTYAEQITINKDITLSGAGKATTYINATSSMYACDTGRTAVVCVKNAAPTIEGFTIDGLNLGVGDLVGVQYSDAGGTLQNNLITNIKQAGSVSGDNSIGVFAFNDDGVSRTLTIDNNEIRNFAYQPIMVSSEDYTTSLDVFITDNDIYGAIDDDGSQMGMMVSGFGGGLIDATITGNHIYEGATGSCDNAGNIGADGSINVWWIDEYTIANNIIENAHLGLSIWGSSGSIIQNIIGMHPTCPVSSLDVYDDLDPVFGPMTIEKNQLSNVRNLTVAEQINAELNWWGQATGPTAAQITGDVTYTPWCTNEACTTFSHPVHNVTQDTWYMAIQPAIEAANANDEIRVANGTYVESPNIYKNLTLIGESEAGVIIDARTFSSYGMEVMGDITTTLKNFTLLGHPTYSSAYGLKVSGDAAFTTIDHVTVTGSWRSGIDLNGLNGGTVSNVTSRNSGYGVGLALTDCSNVAVSNVTTSDNAWGGMAIYTADTGTYSHGSNGVSLSGTNSFGETNKLYIETKPGYPVTNFTQTMFPYTVKNGQFLWFVSNLTEAGGLALGLPASFVTTNSSIEQLSDGSQWVFNGMSIQAAINAAASGDTIHIGAGTYTEDVVLTNTLNPNKQVNLIGEVDGAGEPLPVLLGSLTIDLPFADDGWRIENLNFKFKSVPVNNYLLSLKNITTPSATQGALVKNCTFELFDDPGVYTTDKLAISVPTVTSGNHHLTIEDCEFRNGFNNVIQGYFNDLKVKDSLIKDVKSGINFQGGTGGLTVTNTIIDITADLATDNSYGIRMSSPNLNVTGSTLIVNDLVPADATYYHSAIVIRGSGSGMSSVAEENTILGGVRNETATAFDASPNYWGSPCGPAAIYGLVTVAPWYIDSSMSATMSSVASGTYTFQTGMTTAEMNRVIACAAPNTTLTFDGAYPGGLIVPPDRHHLTFLLKDGTVITGPSATNGYCLNIQGDYIQVKGESNAGAKCVPTNGWPGIFVNYFPDPWNSPLTSLLLEGIEIDGSQSSAQGIWSAYFITDLQILNNYIHDTGAEVMLFEEDINGTFEVQGNMLKDNEFGVADLTSHLVNPNQYDFEFNSWGSYLVDSSIADGSGFTTIDFDPWTHAELFVEHVAGSSPWTDRVFSDNSSTITYAVKADFKEIMGAQFDLKLPAGVTVVSTSMGSVFNSQLPLTVTSDRITFAGSQAFAAPAISGEDLTLFTVTLKTDVQGTYPLTITEDTAVFSMLPWEMVGENRVTGGSSTWVYLDEVHNAAFTAFEAPSITSTDIQGYYISGIPQEFSVLTTNPVDGGAYTNVLFNYRISGANLTDVAGFEYLHGTTWLPMPLTADGGDLVGYFGPTAGFVMGPDYSANTRFRITFNTAKSYPFVLTLNDLSADPDAELARLQQTAVVYQQPAITSPDIQGYYLTGEQREFTVNVNNPVAPAGHTYYPVMFKFTIEGATLADVTSAEYYETYDPAGTWPILPLKQVGDDVVGWYGLINYGGFNLPADGVDHPGLLRVDFAAAGEYPVLVELFQLDGDIDTTYAYDDDIVRKVAEEQFSMTAYEKPVITPTNLGGLFDAGVAETVSLSVTNPSPVPEPFELVFAYPAGTVIQYGASSYTCAAACPAIPVSLPVGATVFGFSVTFDESWAGTAGVSLFDSDWTPADRLLASVSAEGVVVNSGFALTGTFRMQGRSYRGDIPVTLTWDGTLAPYAPLGTTLNQISNNLAMTLQYGGTYTITTNQPRYLNVTADLGKTVTITGDRALANLELKGGNAVWTDNVIALNDATTVASNFGKPDFYEHSDVNFDNKVNVQDLALVGGNFDLTSEKAYATAPNNWVP